MKLSSLRAFGLAFSCALSLAATGCSIDLGQVFESSDNNSNAGGGGRGGNTTAPQGGGGNGGDTGAQGGGGSSNTTSTSDTGTTSTSDTGTTTTSTSSTTTSVTGFTIDCGNSQCESETQGCCWNDFADQGAGECQDSPVTTDSCNNQLEQDGLKSIITCQSQSHCSGAQICCGHRIFFQNTAFYDVVACQDVCTYPDLVLCDGPGDDAGCPQVTVQGQSVQTTCKPSNRLPPGYYICSTN